MKNLKKILSLLTKAEKKKAAALLFLILVMAFFETLGVASILPFVSLIVNPKIVETNIFLNSLFDISKSFGVRDLKDFFLLIGLAVFLIFVFSLFLRATTQYFQIRYTLLREYSISKRLIEGYLNQPYIWFLKQHSGDIGKNILSEVNQVIYQTILPLLNLIAQSAVVVCLLFLLIITNPFVSLIVGAVLILSYIIIFFFIKNILLNIGKKRLGANQKRFISVSEAFNAIKEIKANGFENIYIQRFSSPALTYAKNQSLAQILSLTPRYFIEGIAFGGIMMIILVLIFKNNDFKDIVPLIALYTFAGYRLLPSMQQIYRAFTQLRFSQSTVDLLYKDLNNLKSENLKDSNKNIIFKNNITLKNVNFYYPGSDKLILKKINFTIPKKKKIAIVGPTGSGKTTLLDIILGLIKPTSGNLNVDNQTIDESNQRSWQKNIGYVPQQIYLNNSSILENITLGSCEKKVDFEKLKEVTKLADIHNFIQFDLNNGYNTIVGEKGSTLSGGQKQRIGIAKALYKNPSLLILDEATNALDSITENRIFDNIENHYPDLTVLVITHRLNSIKNFDTIFLIEDGYLKNQGTFNDLKNKNEIFKKNLNYE